MNKLIIPAILTATVMVAAVFATMPIEKASTVHTTIISTIGGSLTLKDVFLDINTATSGNKAPVNVDLLVVRHDGTTVTGLTLSSFSASFAAGTSGTASVTVASSGGGAYRLAITPSGNWATGRTDIAITASSGGSSGSALVVAAIT